MNVATLITQLGLLAKEHPVFVQSIISVVEAAYRAFENKATSQELWKAAMLRFLNKSAPYLGAAFANELIKLQSAGQLDIR